MAAQLRDYYLSTLGVVQYVPKEFLVPEVTATAEASSDLIQEADRQSRPIAVPSSIPEVGMARSIADQLTQDKPEVETAKPLEAKEANLTEEPDVIEPPFVESKSVSPQPISAPRDTTQVKFRIASWQPTSDTLVFSSLDYGQNPQQDQHQLLANILNAVQRLSAPLTEPELHDWPVIPNAPAGKADAKSMFSEYLNTRITSGEVKWVLIFGDRAGTYLLAKGEAQPENQSTSLAEGVEAMVMPGLDEMLADSSQKRVAWNLLRPLAGA